jgi:dihydroneopterin aldolase
MDIIFLGQLEADAIIGIYDWERETRQTIVLDIEMAFDIKKAAETDDIQHTLDYKAVTERVVAFVEQSSYYLVETLIEKIADLILSEFNTPWVRIVLNKRGAITRAKDVGIIIERGIK